MLSVYCSHSKRQDVPLSVVFPPLPAYPPTLEDMADAALAAGQPIPTEIHRLLDPVQYPYHGEPDNPLPPPDRAAAEASAAAEAKKAASGRSGRRRGKLIPQYRHRANPAAS